MTSLDESGATLIYQVDGRAGKTYSLHGHPVELVYLSVEDTPVLLLSRNTLRCP